MSDEKPEPVVPKPASTIIPLRDAESGFEVLLVQRAKRDGSEGIWVFPGGKVEAAELEAANGDAIAAARMAGVRETWEEAGFQLEADSLSLIARWITPPMSPKRFDTWFFAAHVARETRVVVDGGEILRHRWFDPTAAIAAMRSGEIGLAPPTYVTICWLEDYPSVSETLAGLGRDRVPTFEPNIRPLEAGACILYPGDVGYEDGDHERAGARNRLWHEGGGMRYERSSG